MTTSSRKKGILPVRLGLEPDNKTALKELKMDPDLANKMTDEELDKLRVSLLGKKCDLSIILKTMSQLSILIDQLLVRRQI